MDTHNLLKYQGRPLDASRRDIRLLHLHPSSTDRITASLGVKDLASAAGTFACVSYVWGDPNKTVPIEVDDQEVQITTNLFDFLCHIRDPKETLTLWADAICINQADLNEKSHQVVMMGDIYSGCSVVHIWLGTIPDTLPSGTSPFAWIEHMAEGKHWHTLPGILDEQDGKPSEEFNNHRLAFDLMISNPWWQRAWTVQEVILPKSTILWYGAYHTTWNSFAQAIRNQDTRLIYCCLPEILEKKHWLKIKVIHAFMEEHGTINWFREYYHGRIATIPGHTSTIEGVMPFNKTLLSFSKRQCHDPRDKVFSILALAPPQMFENYKPDYTEPLAETWTDVYRLMIDHTADVSGILQGDGFGPNNDGRPSWVRDLANIPTDTVRFERIRVHLAGMYLCSGESAGTFISTDLWELHVKARKADVIRHVGAAHTFKSGPRAMIANMRQWYRLAMEALSCTDEAIIRKLFQRAICATVHTVEDGFSSRRSTDEDLPSLEDWQKFLDLEPDVYPFHITYLAPVLVAVEDRCFYMTDKGNMGLAYPGVRAGDEVCALMGMRVPVVLRKAEVEHDDGSVYQFLGDCFLLDHMDGEIMQNEEETKSIVLI